MSEKYELGSPAYFAALHGALVAARPHIQLTRDFSICEVLTNVPAHIPSDDGRLAFTAAYWAANHEVKFELRETDDVDVKLTWDYRYLFPIARFVVGGDPARQAEFEALVAKAVADGVVTIVGTPATEGGTLVHDAMATLVA